MAILSVFEMSRVRLIDCEPRKTDKDEVVLIDVGLPRVGEECVIGRNVKAATVAYIKREASAETTDNFYRERYINEYAPRVRSGTPMGRWKQDKNIAERLGCGLFFFKESKDGRYRIELEVNFAGN